MEVFEDDEEMNEYLDTMRTEMKSEVDEMNKNYSRLRRAGKKDKARLVPSWIYFTENSDDKKEQERYYEYCEFFNEFKYGKFFRYVSKTDFLTPKHINMLIYYILENS